MKKSCFLFLVISLLFFSVCSNSAHAIRIGLKTNVHKVVVGTSVQGIISDRLNGKIICSLDPLHSYKLVAHKNSIEITIDGKNYDLGTPSVIIEPSSDGFVSTKNKWYRGKLIITCVNKKLIVINELNLEDYLLGVLPCEMPSLWPEEALKAQAIAARSYAVANIGKYGSKGFDLKDTTEDQVYGGASSETQRTNQIVAETYGIVVTQNKKVIPAYYCASAGGKTVNSGDVWVKDMPFLRSVPSYDDEFKKNGHGIGMSQQGAKNLATKGYNAYQILSYYFNNIKFGKLSSNFNI